MSTDQHNANLHSEILRNVVWNLRKGQPATFTAGEMEYIESAADNIDALQSQVRELTARAEAAERQNHMLVEIWDAATNLAINHEDMAERFNSELSTASIIEIARIRETGCDLQKMRTQHATGGNEDER